MRTRAVASVAATLMSVGCGKADTARIAVGVQGNTELLRPALTVTVSGRGFARTWQGSDITSPEAPNYAPAVQTPHVGKLTISATLRSGNDTTRAEVELDARADWQWGVDIWLFGQNPTEGCMGCMGVRAFSVPAALQVGGTDSLYLVWGGNSISHPVIY